MLFSLDVLRARKGDCLMLHYGSIASGALASLLSSGAKLTDQVLLISALDADADGSLSVAAKRIGGPLLFGRIWERLGIAAVLAELLKHRAFEFAVERAVFVATLHRLFVSGSDRDCSSWMADYDIAGVDGPTCITSIAPWRGSARNWRRTPRTRWRRAASRTVIEERLFDQRRDLFTDLSVVFMDTTTPIVLRRRRRDAGRAWPFEGLSARPEANDPRPSSSTVTGAPLCTEMWARQHRRRHGAVAGDRSAAPALRHRPRLRRRRPRHDLGRDHRRARRAPA